MTRDLAGAGLRPDVGDALASDGLVPGAVRDGVVCDLYEPGHLIHYKHQAGAVHSPGRPVRDALLDGSVATLMLGGGEELHWRHHDPARLRRIVELLHGRCVVYLDFHALRVGPYWFNCATEHDAWHDCQVLQPLDPPAPAQSERGVGRGH